jgi:aminopeptidase N
MEHQTCTSLGSANESVVAHELAHQWWGDLITLRSWAHTWLNESFATYSDYLYFRHDRGDDEGALNLQGKLNAYLREAKTRYVRPIVTDRYDQPGDMFDSHAYPKGALVLHMLRQQLGDAAFFDTLKHFLHRYAFEPVDTGDFIRSVKTVTGQNLDWFFDQWLFKPGHPVFDVRSEWDPARKVVVLKVAQVQDFSRGIPVFRVPVSVAIVTDAGRSASQVWMREREESFEFPSETRPLLVRFDPDNVLLKEITFSKQRDELLYQLSHDDVIGRMTAAADLATLKGDPAAVAGLAASAQRDAFWAVRRAAIEALARAGGAASSAPRSGAAEVADQRPAPTGASTSRRRSRSPYVRPSIGTNSRGSRRLRPLAAATPAARAASAADDIERMPRPTNARRSGSAYSPPNASRSAAIRPAATCA